MAWHDLTPWAGPDASSTSELFTIDPSTREANLSQYFGIDWLAMGLTFTAIYLLGSKSRWGFLVMMVGNLCWSAIGIWAHSYAMILANLGFFAMNVRGFVKWAPSGVATK